MALTINNIIKEKTVRQAPINPIQPLQQPQQPPPPLIQTAATNLQSSCNQLAAQQASIAKKSVTYSHTEHCLVSLDYKAKCGLSIQ